LADGFDVDTLKRAVAGIWVSRFHLGENDRAREYTDLTLALRDASHVEQFAALVPSGGERAQKASRKTLFGPRSTRPEDEEPTLAEREESARILREGFTKFEAAIAAKGAP
jgi:hypothetical protein